MLSLTSLTKVRVAEHQIYDSDMSHLFKVPRKAQKKDDNSPNSLKAKTEGHPTEKEPKPKKQNTF